MADYDVLVIGAGPGGYPAAIRAAQLGLNTACVEKEKLGGVCLNWGCIPSKALLKTAELAHKIRHADDYGLSAGELGVDYPKIIKRSRKVSTRFEKGVKGLFKKYGVNHLSGTARLTAPDTVVITSSEGEQTVTAKHIIVATGARARTFPGIEADGERILTYREAIVSEVQPKSVVVLGAGAIGMEFAYFYNAVGTDVTVVEGLSEILPLEDQECAAVVRKGFAKSGVKFELGRFVKEVRRKGDGCEVELQDGTVLDAEYVLVALGITPNSAGIGLEEVGVKLERGFIATDSSMRTNVSGVYAIGDITTTGGLAHTATRQAHVCVERIAGEHVMDVDYGNIPACTYCQPQIAHVGLTEKQATEAGKSFKVGKFPFMANGKAQGAGAPDGFVKVLVDDQYGEILGAHIVGSEATEMIAEFTLARAAEVTAHHLIETVHAHPTYSEAMLEAVANALGVSVHI
ncbi:MAG: dihydrolipoyl dehydrogenase [Deltaproteobacteria bacterium]|nr:MAG: dihydrolipoyl dehydrogenase [Deltaproteobacteria bacterium]